MLAERLPILENTPSNTHSSPSKLRAKPTSEDANFAGNVALVTLGCAKNLVDSELMLGVLQSSGFRTVPDPKNADLIVVNTCAFLQSAVEEGIDTILELAKYKTTGRCRQLVVAGCMVERYRSELEIALPEVDRFLSTDELLLVGKTSATSLDCFNEARRPYFLYDETMPRVLATEAHTAYVKIAEGCDRPCTFCIIPKIRGSFRSRPIDSVVNEVMNLFQNSVKEVNLIAQDLTNYGSDFTENGRRKSELIHLLEKLSCLGSILENGDQLPWLRLLYAYPVGVDERLIRTIANSPVIANYLDLPLQHVSHPVLKAMRRPLGEKRTRDLIDQIRKIAPEIALRTTFIVGFPGETDHDIETLHDFIGEGHFTHVGVFSYSQEREALSFDFSNQVAQTEKQERVKWIMERQQQIVQDRLQSYLGKQQRVLIDGTHHESDLLLVGRAQWQAPETDGEIIINEIAEDVFAMNSEMNNDEVLSSFKGRFVTVEISEVAGYDLVGTLVEVE